jgi:hypothetical protein
MATSYIISCGLFFYFFQKWGFDIEYFLSIFWVKNFAKNLAREENHS